MRSTQKCPRCSRELPLQNFFKNGGGTGRLLKTCEDCRGFKQVQREYRACPGLPESWGFPKCEKKVDSTYRCTDCDKIWKSRHGVVDGRYHGQEYGGAIQSPARRGTV